MQPVGHPDRSVNISHAGLDTQLGSYPPVAGMMRLRLIGQEQAKTAAHAGAIGVWTHLADRPLDQTADWPVKRRHPDIQSALGIAGKRGEELNPPG